MSRTSTIAPSTGVQLPTIKEHQLGGSCKNNQLFRVFGHTHQLLHWRENVEYMAKAGADPGINYEGQVGGAQEYEYHYEGRRGAQAYSTM